jgi:glycine betaine catabolism B
MAVTVEFRKSGKRVRWDGSHESILELAEDNGIEIESECRAGICGTCKVKLVSGDVVMDVADGLGPGEKEEGWILACVSVPTTDVVIDA